MASHALEALVEDHRAVNRAFARYEDAPPCSAERDSALDEIRRRLAWHVATEQQFLFPMLSEHLPDADEVVGREIDDNASSRACCAGRSARPQTSVTRSCAS
jgi:hypothetical protein